MIIVPTNAKKLSEHFEKIRMYRKLLPDEHAKENEGESEFTLMGIGFDEDDELNVGLPLILK